MMLVLVAFLYTEVFDSNDCGRLPIQSYESICDSLKRESVSSLASACVLLAPQKGNE